MEREIFSSRGCRWVCRQIVCHNGMWIIRPSRRAERESENSTVLFVVATGRMAAPRHQHVVAVSRSEMEENNSRLVVTNTRHGVCEGAFHQAHVGERVNNTTHSHGSTSRAGKEAAAAHFNFFVLISHGRALKF